MNKQMKIEIVFGPEVSDSARIFHTGLVASVCRRAFELFGFYTYQEKSVALPDGSDPKEERGGCIMLYMDDTPSNRDRVHAFAGYIKSRMNRECIALIISPVEFLLV